MSKTMISWAAIFLALAVALGAFGAHALKSHIPGDMLLVFETGVKYQFYHALGLLLVGVIELNHPSRWLRLSALFLATGILLFSGSLYILAITGNRAFGAITPIGGVSFIAGWVLLLVAAVKR